MKSAASTTTVVAAVPPVSGGARLETSLREPSGCEVLVVEGEQVVAWTTEIGACLRLPIGRGPTAGVSELPSALHQIIRDAARGLHPITDRRVLLETSATVAGPFHVQALPVKLPTGLTQVTLVFSKISASAVTEQTIRRLDRLASIGTLSASMAHEVKNAFVAVKTFIDLLLEKNHDADLADVVRREMRRIDLIVTQMLRFAAPAPPKVRIVRTHDTLAHTLRMVQHHLNTRMIELRPDFAAAGDAVEGDDYQVEQALLNLLLNAIEAIGTNGTLTVQTDHPPKDQLPPVLQQRAAGYYLRIRITDTGAGITPGNLEKLFEPFFTTKPNGTGLGLAISRRIVEEHGGTITVQSTAGQGATFSLFLPLSTLPA